MVAVNTDLPRGRGQSSSICWQGLAHQPQGKQTPGCSARFNLCPACLAAENAEEGPAHLTQPSKDKALRFTQQASAFVFPSVTSPLPPRAAGERCSCISVLFPPGKLASAVEGVGMASVEEQKQQQSYFVRLGSLSTKIRHRAYQHSLSKLQRVKQSTQDTLSRLQLTIKLVQTRFLLSPPVCNLPALLSRWKFLLHPAPAAFPPGALPRQGAFTLL